MKILFVCTGNTCRSPMAQGLAKELFGGGYTLISAGLAAMPNAAASAHAVTVMDEWQIDIRGHRAKLVSEKLIYDADLILTMTDAHKKALITAAPGKVYTLGEYAAGEAVSISDPYGSGIDVYRSCAEEIHMMLLTIKNKLRREAKLDKHLNITKHPLVKSKLTMLRDKETGNKEFRELVREIATFMCYEATLDAPLVEIEVETPVSKTKAPTTERKYAIVPILRAGLGMVEGVSGFLPTAKIGHIGLYRDPESLQPVEYYCKLPPDCVDREILVLEPMIATGGTTDAAINYFKKCGITRIKLLSLLASPEGIKRLEEKHPDVKIYTAALDECLNDHGYIVPGLGDAGDRLFGTK